MARLAGSALRIESPLGTAVAMLRATLAPLPGVLVTAVGVRNLSGGGPDGGLVSQLGVGRLTLAAAGTLAWREPGAAADGTAVDVSAGGDFTLAGSDPDAWLDVTIDEDLLTHGSALVELEPTFNNALANSDVTDLATPPTEAFPVKLVNHGAADMQNLTAWLDGDTPDNRWLTLKFAAGAYAQTWNETDALAAHGAQTIAAGANLTCTVRRTAVTPAAHWRRVVRIRLSWDDTEGGRAYSEAVALYRTRGAAQYEAFQATGQEPDVDHDTAVVSGAALPLVCPAVLTTGDFHHALALRNAYGVLGGSASVERITVAAGVLAANAPDGALDTRVEPQPGGVTRVIARYAMPESSDRRPSEWALWYTTNGATPGSGSPNYTAALTRSRRAAFWRVDLPAVADGVTVKVLVRVRKVAPGPVYTYQAGGGSASLVVRTAGPAAPAMAAALGSGR